MAWRFRFEALPDHGFHARVRLQIGLPLQDLRRCEHEAMQADHREGQETRNRPGDTGRLQVPDAQAIHGLPVRMPLRSLQERAGIAGFSVQGKEKGKG